MTPSAMCARLAMLTSLFCALISAAVQASITIDQLYSNSDGSIQFVVLSRSGDPLPSLAGRALVASDGTTARRYTFASDVPADRFHVSVLVATQRFADLGKLVPDYIMPDGFLFLANATVALDDAVLDYRGRKLSTDGWHALYRDAFSGLANAYVAAAANSHGDLVPFSRDPTLSGLWWNTAEPGWGLAIEQQTGGLFVVWATFDADGSPTWFFASGYAAFPPCDDEFFCDFDPGEWAGTLYRTSGPAFGAPFESSRVSAEYVGSIDLRIPVGAAAGSFDFQIEGVGGHRSFTRAVFGETARQCFFTSGIVSDASNHQGLWWNASESGWALQLNHQGDAIFAVWFTYDDAGKAVWLTFTAPKTPNGTYSGTVYRTSGAPYTVAPSSSPPVSTAVGSATLAFDDTGHATFTYDVNGVSRTKVIERQRLAADAPICD